MLRLAPPQLIEQAVKIIAALSENLAPRPTNLCNDGIVVFGSGIMWFNAWHRVPDTWCPRHRLFSFMPELPEVEHLRRGLEREIVGCRVVGVTLRRRDVLRIGAHELGTGGKGGAGGGSRNGRASRAAVGAALLHDAAIDRLERHGKQLAIVAHDGRVLVVHLGMSGSMRIVNEPGSKRKAKRSEDGGQKSAAGGQKSIDQAHAGCDDRHVHCEWVLEDEMGRARPLGRRRRLAREPGRRFALPRLGIQFPVERQLVFRDPRRFGGLWSFPSMEMLHAARWHALGPDALTITSAALALRLQRTSRSIKAALLDQAVLAGVGNIYADEALHRALIHPLRGASTLTQHERSSLSAAIRSVLRAAVKAGGSSIRDYVDAAGHNGGYALRHRVYGRAGLPCKRCGNELAGRLISQRSSVFCERCQLR